MDPVSLSIASAALVLQGAGLVKGWRDQSDAEKKQKRARRATLASMREGYAEAHRLSLRDESALVGAQKAAFAGAGVMVGQGTAGVIESDVRSEFKRSRMLAAKSYQAERMGVKAGMSSSGPNYMSGLASLASSAGKLYTMSQETAKPPSEGE